MASGNILCWESAGLAPYGPNPGRQPTASVQRYGNGNHSLAIFPKIASAPNPTYDRFGNLTHLFTAGVGVTLTLMWCCDVAAGNVRWGAQFERLIAGGSEVKTESFAALQAVNAAVAGTADDLVVTDIPFTIGAQMDNVAASEFFRLRIQRIADNAGDTAAVGSIARLLAWKLRDT